MSKIISIKFYSVVINGTTYADTGRSVREVATRNGVNIKDVKIGVDLLHTPFVPRKEHREKVR